MGTARPLRCRRKEFGLGLRVTQSFYLEASRLGHNVTLTGMKLQRVYVPALK